MVRRICLLLLFISACAFKVLGDTIHLKDGTSIEGRVIDQGDKYWIKDSDGESHTVEKSRVASWSKGSDAAPSVTPSTPTAGASSAAPHSYPGGGGFAAVKIKADACDTPIAGVGLWQGFIDSKPSPTELTDAKAELKHWQELVDGSGEKVNGKWIWGAEREKLIAKVSKLMIDGTEALRTNQTLVGIDKLEEAVKLYPNNFEANFELGYFNLLKGVEGGRNNVKIDAGIKSLEMALKVRPTCAAALSDLAIGYSFKQRYQQSVETAYKAAKIEDSKEIVQNLIDSLAYSPAGILKNTKVKPIVDEALILAGKYGIQLAQSEWVWVRPDVETEQADGNSPKSKRHARPRTGGSEEEEEKDGPPGIFAEGTGFFISPAGYILTNRHVAKPGDYLMVRLADQSLKLAERIIIDDEQDMAVIKIKMNDPVPFVRLADYDHPDVGADVCVFGFPLLDRFGLKSSVKMTRGIVTAWDTDNALCDVTVDAIVNPGNSGGPMVDHHGNLLALTAMKTISTDGMISTYGLGYSTQRIRKFFTKQKTKLEAAKLIDGKDSAVLSNEELAKRLTPCTVCILDCRGVPPSLGSNGEVKVPAK